MVIRNERPEDYRVVEELTKKAFWNVYAPGCNEHYLAHILREHADFVRELDLVAELDGKVIANIMFTRSRLHGENGAEKEVLTFGPLSVLPEYQRRGYGKALVKYALGKAAEMGFEAVVISGNPENYVPMGFKSCKRFNVTVEKGVYPTALLVIELKDGALSGNEWIFTESPAYDFDEKAAAEFDKSFPQMPEEYLPSRELFYIYSRSRLH